MPDLPRRAFLGSAIASAAAVSPVTAYAASKAKKGKRKLKDPAVTSGTFDCGVAAGLPTTTGAVLWTHVAGVDRNARLTLEVARDADFKNVVKRQDVRVAKVRDCTARATVGGLQPGEEYFYRFASKTVSSPVGRVRTARPADSREPIKVGFFSCQDRQAGYYNAHQALAEEDLDLVVCLGDYVYEQTFYDGPADRKDATGGKFRPDDPAYVVTLDEWRAKYRLYKSDPDLQALHAAHPFVAIWDDHEVEDNYAADKRDPAKSDAQPFDFQERRRAGYLSFFEYMPRTRLKPVSTQIYGSVPLGLGEVVFLDQRQYRDLQPCGDQLFVPCPDASAPGRSYLGAAQKQFFKDAVTGSKAQWKLVANQLMIMSLDSAPGVSVNVDSWDGYAAERLEVLEHFRSRAVQDLLFMTGDIHSFFAGTVHTTGRSGGAPVGTEFVGGSITSLGLEDTVGPSTPAFEAGIPVTNPHIGYAALTPRGYGVVELTPQQAKVRFMTSDALVKGAPTRQLAAFTVDAGSTEVRPA